MNKRWWPRGWLGLLGLLAIGACSSAPTADSPAALSTGPPAAALAAAPSPTSTGAALFTVPAGPDGVQYGANNSGPAALAVAPDGTFWIADTQGDRLLHYDPQGALLDRIELDGISSLLDVEPTGPEVLALSNNAQVFRFSAGGNLLATYEIPEGLGPEGGLTGLAVGDHGEILVEYEMGAEVAQLVNADGVLEPVRLPGYTHEGALYKARPAGPQRSEGTITAGSVRIDVTVPNVLVGLWLLGFAPDGGFYVVVEEMLSRPPVKVDQTVRLYSPSGDLLGSTRVPLHERHTYVQHGVAVGPDGALYALLTRPDHVQVVRLDMSTDLAPILPAPARRGG